MMYLGPWPCLRRALSQLWKQYPVVGMNHIPVELDSGNVGIRLRPCWWSKGDAFGAEKRAGNSSLSYIAVTPLVLTVKTLPFPLRFAYEYTEKQATCSDAIWHQIPKLDAEPKQTSGYLVLEDISEIFS